MSEPQSVVRDVLFHHLTHLRGRAEETVRGHEPRERLVRALEVVTVDEECEPAHEIGEICEDRPAEELVPERLPKPFRFAERLRVLRAAANVPNSVLAECALEVRLTAPGRVLPPVVRQNLLRRPVRREAQLQRLHHELGALMVRRRVRHDETRVVVHEHRHVHALMASEQKREDVRLPELIRLRPLEAALRVCPFLHPRRRGWNQALLVQDASHLRLAHPERLEARKDVSDATRPVIRMRLAELRHRLALRLVLL